MVIATVLGIAFGHYFPSIAIDLKPLPDIFLRLVKMVIGPIVFVTVVCGISQAGDLKKAGVIGLRALIYFEIVTTLALALGLLVANVVKPGVGISHEILQRGAAAPLVKPAGAGTTVDALVSVFPDNSVNAFATGNLMQILVFAVLFGIAMSSIRSKVESVDSLLEQIGSLCDYHFCNATGTSGRFWCDGFHGLQIWCWVAYSPWQARRYDVLNHDLLRIRGFGSNCALQQIQPLASAQVYE